MAYGWQWPMPIADGESWLLTWLLVSLMSLLPPLLDMYRSAAVPSWQARTWFFIKIAAASRLLVSSRQKTVDTMSPTTNTLNFNIMHINAEWIISPVVSTSRSSWFLDSFCLASSTSSRNSPHWKFWNWTLVIYDSPKLGKNFITLLTSHKILIL